MKHFVAAILCFLSAISSRAGVVINEIHYNPDVKTEHVEFVELYNNGTATADLSGWRFSDGIVFTFPQGTTIAQDGYVVIAGDPAQFAAKFRKTALGPWEGSLSNDGEEIVLRDAAGVVVDKVRYDSNFPWPIVGNPPGYSIELANPFFDNDLGGNWQPSSGAVEAPADVTLIPIAATWKYFKGTQEPSATVGAWRQADFADSTWLTGAMPIGYDPSVPMNTQLSDMAGNYTTVYFRKTFNVDDPNKFTALQLQAMYDDGFKLWINGRLVTYVQMSPSEMPYSSVAVGSARESASYDTFTLPAPADYLVVGQNTIAIQLANILLSGSSDAFLDLALIGKTGGGVGPTPGARNNAFAVNLPPAIRQVDHSPAQPAENVTVTITAKVTDPDGVALVQLQYQVVDPGNYIELTDSAYTNSWTTIAMNDSGANGDVIAGDGIYTAAISPSVQVHRRLVRYRITATDNSGKSITAPYPDDTCPNFAYFCYNGVPAYTAAARPGAGGTLGTVVTYPTNVMSSLPTYHLISKKTSVETSTWIERYGGDLYKWAGTLVYNGKVYDHIHYRSRGGVWRYAMGKNMWKFDFNHGHDFHPRDNWGREYDVAWTKLNLGACIQQGDYAHRGEQGMFESVGFRMFNLAGVEAPKTHFIQFRIIDEASESGANQYNGDFWGLYLAVEQEDSRFIDSHNMPDSNFYKMEGGTGTLNNTGQDGPTDRSDLDSFLTSIRSTQTESWWRTNFDVNRYYSYRTVVESIHHYDIDGDPGKNYFYYTNGVSHKWEVHPWDLDLTWADNMYGSGGEQFKSRVLPIANLNREFKNRIREVRDLLYNTDQVYKLIDEYAAMIYTNGQPSFVGADRAQWDFNPIMVSQYINTSKAGQGLFYQAGLTKDFAGMVKLMKDYVVTRSSVLDTLATDAGLPTRPTITNTSPTFNPANRLSFACSDYSGSAAFAAVQWRLGEITPADRPAYDPTTPREYEIKAAWLSPEYATFTNSISVPAGFVKVGHTYRARVKIKDSVGRWSNWSAPVEFVAGENDTVASLLDNLRVSEVMYNPPLGSDYEFIELYNISTNVTLDLSGVKFTAGIDYTFPTGAALAPTNYALVTRTLSVDAFKNNYNVPAAAQIFGPYSGALANEGEEVTLKTAINGSVIFTFTYNDHAPWPTTPDGDGFSLVPVSVEATQLTSGLTNATAWRASGRVNGSAGAVDIVPNSPQISGAQLDANNFTVHLSAQAGFTYVLEVCADLAAPIWVEVRRIQSTQSGATDLVDANFTTTANRFYRIRAEAP